MSGEDRKIMNPFPGIRPFEPDESGRFFGRDQEIRELLKALRMKRFLAVLGNSGTGKSSLVRAGVIPPLAAGFNVSGPGMWRLAIMRPGSWGHIGRLAEAITSEADDGWAFQGSKADAERTLNRGGLGLIEAAKAAHARSGSRFLLVVDQFEELFGFVDRPEDFAASDEAHAFVRLLVAATRQTEVPIYVIITMRSEFLGHGAALPTFNEEVNENLFLVPALTRDQLREVIEGPLEREGVSIDPSVVSRLINDTMRMPEKLPLLGHALNGLWKAWEKRVGAEQSPLPPIDTADYKEIDGVEGSLEQHLDRLYGGLHPAKQKLAERLFRHLATTLPDGTKVRRPTKLGRFEASSGAKRQDIRDVVEVFRGGPDADRSVGRSFLTLTPANQFDDDTVIDLAHEVIFRRWPLYERWVEEESADTRLFEDLRDVSQQWEASGKERSFLHTGVRLARAELWRTHRAMGSSVLSGQPPEEFKRVVRFLAASSRRADRARLFQRLTAAAFVLMAVVVTVLTQFSARAARVAARSAAASDSATQVAYREARDAAARAAASDSATRAANSALLAADSARVALLVAERRARAQADTQRARAAAQRDTAAARNLVLEALQDTLRSRRLAADATVVAEDDPSLALVLALSALDAAETGDATRALHRAVQRSTVRRIIELGEGELGDVDRLGFAPHGRWLAALTPSRIVVFDASVGAELQVLEAGDGAPADLEAFAFHPDGRRLVAAAGRQLIEWDVPTGEELRRQSFDDVEGFTALAFSPDGGVLTAGGVDGTLTDLVAEDWAWLGSVSVAAVVDDPDRPEEEGERAAAPSYEDWSLVADLAYGPAGSRLATIDDADDERVRLWQRGDGGSGWEPVAWLEGHESSIWDVAFSPRGDLIATASWDGTVGIWSATGEFVRFLRGHTSDVNGVAFSPDGRYLVSTADDQLGIVWDVDRDWSIARRLVGHSDWVQNVDYGPDGRRIVTAGDDGRVILWAAPLMEEIIAIPAVDPTGVARLAYGQQGQEILVSAPSGSIRGVDAATGRELRRFGGRPFGDEGRVVTDASGDLVATSGGGEVTVWGGGPSPVRLVPPDGFDLGLVGDMAFDPAGPLLTLSLDTWLARWDPSTGQLLDGARFGGMDPAELEGDITVALSDGGRVVAAGAPGEAGALVGLVEQWADGDYEGVLNAEQGSMRRLLVDDEATRLVIVHDATATLWDVPSEEQLASLRGHTGPITGADVDPQWRFLATSSADGTVRLWDLRRPRGGTVIASGLQGTTAVRFRPDGEAVAVGSRDGTRVYAVGTEALRALARDRLARGMTEDECEQYLSEGCSGNLHSEVIIEARELALLGELEEAAALFGQIPEGELGRQPRDEAGRLFASVLSARANFAAAAGDSARAGALLAQARDLAPGVFGPLLPLQEEGSQQMVRLTTDAERLVGFRRFDEARATADEVRAIDASEGAALASWIDQTEAALLLSDADALARSGNTDEANRLLSRMGELDPDRNVSTARADSIYVTALLEEGDELIRRGRRPAAEAIYTDALTRASELDLGVRLDFLGSERADSVQALVLFEEAMDHRDAVPTELANLQIAAERFREAGRLYAPANLDSVGGWWIGRDAAFLARSGRVDEATAAMGIAVDLDAAGPAARDLNDLCWYGALGGYAAEVGGYCEDAVDLASDPSNPDHELLPNFRDSRGVARALNGDFEGAIADFLAVVGDDSGLTAAEKATRQAWVDELRRGIDPFDEETLSALRGGVGYPS